MTDRDKLIKLITKAHIEWLQKEYDHETNKSVAEYLADYLLANGVIVPPCKVGQTVYKVVNDKRVKKPYECEVVGFWYSEDENCNNVHLVRYVNGAFDCSFSVPFADFGKTVFLTKEEAEEKLKELWKDEKNL